MSPKQRETILKLQKLDPNSIEFFDVATNYFAIKSRSDRSCGAFFVFLALFGICIMAFTPPDLTKDLVFGCLFIGSALFGGTCLSLGWKHLVQIKKSRAAGAPEREHTLRCYCSQIYCSQPIGVFILRQLGDDAEACMRSFSTKVPKAKWIENREKILREQVNRELSELLSK